MMIMISISLYSFKYHGNQKPKKPQERTNEQDIRNQRGNAHHSTTTSECRRLYFGKKEFNISLMKNSSPLHIICR